MGTSLERNPISVQELLRQNGILRSRDFALKGISRQQLKRLTDSGEIAQLGRGLYGLPDAVGGASRWGSAGAGFTVWGLCKNSPF